MKINKGKVRYLFYNKNLSYSQIGELFGFSRQYIYKIISSNSKKVKEIRIFVKKRDDNRCQFCSSTNRIHIHHIDKNKKNNSPKNLICLCLKCHQWVHDQERKVNLSKKF